MVAFGGFLKRSPSHCGFQVTVGFNTVHHDGQKAALGFRQSLAAMPLGDRAALDFRQDIIVVSVVVDDVDRVQRQRYHPIRSDFSEVPAACDGKSSGNRGKSKGGGGMSRPKSPGLFP